MMSYNKKSFTQGIFLGVLIILESIHRIKSMDYLNQKFQLFIWAIILILGVIQIVASYDYLNGHVKIKALMLILGIEVIYYVVAIILVLCMRMDNGNKIFGLLVGIGMLGFTFFSLLSLLKNYKDS